MCISFLTICVFIWYLWSTIGGTDKPTSSLRWKSFKCLAFYKKWWNITINTKLFVCLSWDFGWVLQALPILQKSQKYSRMMRWKALKCFERLLKWVSLGEIDRWFGLCGRNAKDLFKCTQIIVDYVKKSAKIRLRPIESANQVPKQGFH